MQSAHRTKAFTLIELLIVVAIIGILAAIAVPNFLNAQVRAKLAKVKSDLRSIAQAQDMYFLDTNTYPPESEDNIFTGRRSPSEAGLFFLTHPVAYMSSIPHDPFQDTAQARFEGTAAAYETGVASVWNDNKMRHIAFCIFSRGPDRIENGLYSAAPFAGPQRNNGRGNTYAVSNGLNSRGDIYWFGGDSKVVNSLGIDGRIYHGSFPPNFGG